MHPGCDVTVSPAHPPGCNGSPRHHSTACVTIRHDFEEYWRNTWEMLRPWRENGTVAGVFLGDEQCYHGASLENLTLVAKRLHPRFPSFSPPAPPPWRPARGHGLSRAVLNPHVLHGSCFGRCAIWCVELWTSSPELTNVCCSSPGVFSSPLRPSLGRFATERIRRDWPEAVLYINEAQDLLMCNFNRLNETFFHAGDCWPKELDWLGFDIYGFETQTTYQAARDAHEWNLFPRMSHPRQFIIQTTVGHGGHTPDTETWTVKDYDDFCVRNAELWFEYAEQEPRVGGVFPWYWRTGSYYPAPPSVPRVNITYGIGLDRLRRCAAAFDAWGAKVRSHTPSGRIIPHNGTEAGRHRFASGARCQPGGDQAPPWRVAADWGFCDTHH